MIVLVMCRHEFIPAKNSNTSNNGNYEKRNFVKHYFLFFKKYDMLLSNNFLFHFYELKKSFPKTISEVKTKIKVTRITPRSALSFLDL